MVENLKIWLDLLVDLVILVTFLWGWRSLRNKVDAPTRNLYIENCKEVQRILDNIVQTAKAEMKDVYDLKDCKRNAELYLDNDTAEFIQKIIDDSAELNKIFVENKAQNTHNNAQKIGELIKNISSYRTNLIACYRKKIRIF